MRFNKVFDKVGANDETLSIDFGRFSYEAGAMPAARVVIKGSSASSGALKQSYPDSLDVTLIATPPASA